jgi:predicted RND superfamily exporter protein
MSNSFVHRLARQLYASRSSILAILALISVVLIYQAFSLRIDAGFQKQIPLEHPYMKVFMKHRHEFGGANRIMVAVESSAGDIFTPEFFTLLKQVSDEVFFIPGVNRSTVRSIFTPNERFVEIVDGGFSGGNIVPADFKPSPMAIAAVRDNILKAGAIGRLVANDFSAAMISAQLVENDPQIGEKLDYFEVARLLEDNLRRKFETNEYRIHIIGFAKAVGDIADGGRSVVALFGVSFAATAIFVTLYTGSPLLSLLALGNALLSVGVALGLVATLGFGIDPMSILVPFLVFAIGVSHGVQVIMSFGERVASGQQAPAAAQYSFERLLVPGLVALFSDAVGFLTIAVIKIQMIQELALTAAIGTGILVIFNFFALPLLLSYIRPSPALISLLQSRQQSRDLIWRLLNKLSAQPAASIAVAAAVLLALAGWIGAQRLQIGDLEAGVPELHPESRYNQDARFITTRFSIGVDILQTIVEGPANGCIDHSVMGKIDDLQWTLANTEGVRSTISLPQVARLINAGFQEGHPKWRVLPFDSQSMVQAVGPVETATGLLNSDCSVMPVIAFLEDHRAPTLERVVAVVENFASTNDSENLKFRLATGHAGVLAATNEVVKNAQWPMLLYIYAAVIISCLLTFRSLSVTLSLIFPLVLVSLLASALMALLGIGLKVSTLPITALGVGIGVDYGIYLFSELRRRLANGDSLSEAYLHTLRTTGSAVLVTGFTLSLGVSTWIFSSLKFQADMGVLLAFMLAANMCAALILIPALCRMIYHETRR